MSSVNSKISEVIDALALETTEQDSYLFNVSKRTIQRFAVKGYRELIMKSHIGQVRGLRMSVSDNNSVVLPEDYVKYIRISEMSECGKLKPIAVDASYSTANVYLLDHLDNILLDQNGVALLGSGDSDINRNCVEFDYSSCSAYRSTHYYSGYYGNYSSFYQYYNLNDSFVPDVTFKEDTFNNKFQFSGRALDEVVVEYIADPIKSAGSPETMDVETLFMDTLEKYVYMEIVSRKRDSVVPPIEKRRARDAYRESLLLAKIAKHIPPTSDLTSTTNLK